MSIPEYDELSALQSGEEGTEVPSAPSTRHRHNNVLPIVLIIAIVLAIILVNVLPELMMTDEERWQKQYDLGQQYLVEMDYEQAIVAFTAAIEIDANDASAWIGRAQSYYALGVQEIETVSTDSEDTGIPEAAQTYLSAALEDYETAFDLGDTQPDTYLGTAEVYVAMGDYDSAVTVLEEGAEANPESEEIAVRLDEVTKALNLITLQTDYWDIVMNVISAVTEDITVLGIDDWYGDEFQEFLYSLSGLDEPLILQLDSGWYLGLYYVTGYGSWIYYGEMEDGIRSGEGYWIYAGGVKQEAFDRLEEGDGLTANRVFYGEWSGDLPNGWGRYCETIIWTDGSLETLIYEINFVDGWADGSGTFTDIVAGGTDRESGTGSCAIEAEDGYFVSLYGGDLYAKTEVSAWSSGDNRFGVYGATSAETDNAEESDGDANDDSEESDEDAEADS